MAATDGNHPGRIHMPAATLGPGGPVVSRIGLGLAALGRPAYITAGRADDLPDRSVAGLRARTFAMLDAAYAAGIRYADAARSYGRAEEFLGGWLAERRHPDLIAGSKWGYRYTGGWRVDAEQQEVKEHSLAMFTAQLTETRALLGDRLALYQVHSLTVDSPLFADPPLLAALARLRAEGVIIGMSASGPHQAGAIRRALDLTVDGQQLFAEAEVTWNLLEPSAGPALQAAHDAGLGVIVKEALANGRLTPRNDEPAFADRRRLLEDEAARRCTSIDALALAVAWDDEAAQRLGGLVEPPEAYWNTRGGLAWN